jgi:methylphosphotriester-DNA--protein-cysteine methyltransferase
MAQKDTPTSAMDDTVFVTVRSDCFHTTPHCSSFNQSENIQEKPITALRDDFPICKRCSDEYEPSATPKASALREQLEQLNPDDVG